MVKVEVKERTVHMIYRLCGKLTPETLKYISIAPVVKNFTVLPPRRRSSANGVNHAFAFPGVFRL